MYLFVIEETDHPHVGKKLVTLLCKMFILIVR